MSLRHEQSAFAKDVNNLLTYIHSAGWEISFGEVLRTPEQQDLYVKSGKSMSTKSNHLLKCAIDMNFFLNGELKTSKQDLQKFGDYWESLHPKNRWGGNWKSFQDCPHFERNQY